jgi:hypothetical protein
MYASWRNKHYLHLSLGLPFPIMTAPLETALGPRMDNFPLMIWIALMYYPGPNRFQHEGKIKSDIRDTIRSDNNDFSRIATRFQTTQKSQKHSYIYSKHKAKTFCSTG